MDTDQFDTWFNFVEVFQNIGDSKDEQFINKLQDYMRVLESSNKLQHKSYQDVYLKEIFIIY